MGSISLLVISGVAAPLLGYPVAKLLERGRGPSSDGPRLHNESTVLGDGNQVSQSIDNRRITYNSTYQSSPTSQAKPSDDCVYPAITAVMVVLLGTGFFISAGPKVLIPLMSVVTGLSLGSVALARIRNRPLWDPIIRSAFGVLALVVSVAQLNRTVGQADWDAVVSASAGLPVAERFGSLSSDERQLVLGLFLSCLLLLLLAAALTTSFVHEVIDSKRLVALRGAGAILLYSLIMALSAVMGLATVPVLAQFL